MAWVVDTCVLIDVLDADILFGKTSSRCLDYFAEEGLVLAPVTYVELAPSFLGEHQRQDSFLSEVGVDCTLPWEWADTLAAHTAWSRYVTLKREKKMKRRPIADVQIGAFALRFDGLITRNGDDFKKLFPKLNVVKPKR